jgi:porin
VERYLGTIFSQTHSNLTVADRGLIILVFSIWGIALGSGLAAKETVDQNTFLGGPASVGAVLSEEHEVERKPDTWWRKLGARLRQQHYLDIGLDYSALAQRAVSGDSGSSGVFRVYGRWTLTGRDTVDTGTLVWKLENRSAFTQPPGSLGQRIGYFGVTGTSFNDAGWFLAPFYWEQYLNNGNIGLVAGRLDPLDFVDVSGYSGQWTRFQNASLLVNSTIAYPDLGYGLGAGVKPTAQTVLGFTVHDANGEVDSLAWFPDGPEFFSQVYLSWAPDRSVRFDRAVHLTLWHVDERVRAGVPEGYGIAFSANWLTESGWMPFVRAGLSKGDAARADQAVTLGSLFRPENKIGEFGVALGWERLSDETLGDQRVAEAFFRWDASDIVQITPSIQAIFDTPFTTDRSTELVLGLRVRFSF